jgi:hypothetical protein
MRCRGITTMSILLAISVYAANPFLDAADDKPVSAKFRGTEWGDEIQQDEALLTYESSHSSGHFKKVVWKKGVGLLEYGSGYGAHADGLNRNNNAKAISSPKLCRNLNIYAIPA